MAEPESSNLEYVPAALWRRVLARVIDYLAMFWLLFALSVLGLSFWVTNYSSDVAPSPWGESFLVVVTLAVFYGILEVVYLAKRGQSPAKELLKLRVVHPDHPAGLGWGLALKRWLIPGVLMLLPVWAIPVALALVGLPALFDPQRRTLYDRLAATTVVPYDAKAVEGPIRTRRRRPRSQLDRDVEAFAGKPEGTYPEDRYDG